MSCHSTIWNNLLFCCSLFLIFPLYTLVYQGVNEIFHVNKILVACWFSHIMIFHEHFSVSHNIKKNFQHLFNQFSVAQHLPNFFFYCSEQSMVITLMYLSLYICLYSLGFIPKDKLLVQNTYARYCSAQISCEVG